MKDFPPGRANYVPLTPASFLKRAAKVFADKTAIVYNDLSYSYREFSSRSTRLAGALTASGVDKGDVVAVMLPNVPAMLECHFGVPLSGAILCCINIRLDAPAVDFILKHSEAKTLIVDTEFVPMLETVLEDFKRSGDVILVEDASVDFPVSEKLRENTEEYNGFLSQSPQGFVPLLPEDEWQSIGLNYTSGTTGDPKGVLISHRGAYLNACANALNFQLTPESIYLWTLPMFHCNGWTFPWVVTLQGGRHVCMRSVNADEIIEQIVSQSVTHFCAAPVVLNMLLQRIGKDHLGLPHSVQVATGGAPPPSKIIEIAEQNGFRITHLYGMTECYGPGLTCFVPEAIQELPLSEKADFMARQGVQHPLVEDVTVIDPETGNPVPNDGATLGELLLRGNTVMKGYYKNPEATASTLADGWLHTGDLAVVHSDNYVQIKDRSKDVIISGGENISSLEVEQVLYQHPAVLEAAVVAQPDEFWGETPHAFIAVNPEYEEPLEAREIIEWCRGRLAHYKCPRYVTFSELPKTSTGKIQKHILRAQVSDGK